MKRITNAPLKSLNTFGVGGNANEIIYPENLQEIQKIIGQLNQQKTSYKLIGLGSNLLISDNGFDGAIISLREMDQARRLELDLNQKEMMAGAAISLTKISNFLIKENCTDFIKLGSIPGSLGGAIKMNAGCLGRTISDNLISINIINHCGELEQLSKEQLDFSYRHSNINSQQFIIDAKFKLTNFADNQSIKKEREEVKEKRAHQPYRFKNAGSVFKNGTNYFAGALIENAGLKGVRIGDAEVSDQHANFIINRSNASAADIYNLICLVQNKVFEHSGIKLELEIELVGNF